MAMRYDVTIGPSKQCLYWVHIWNKWIEGMGFELDIDIIYDLMFFEPLLKIHHLFVAIFVVHNDGIWWMVQWGPCAMHYHIKLQTISPIPMDGCIKQEVVDVPKWLAYECLHCGWCKGRDK